MELRSLLVALVIGVIQGVFEWLPISSEGNVTLALTALGSPPADAVRLSLFLHAGTAVAATAYYRGELGALVRTVPDWRPRSAFAGSAADFSFLAVATLVSAGVGIAAYASLVELATELAGGAFVALVGGLLIVTGALQRAADRFQLAARDRPDAVDAVLVGVGQGLAVLPGVSRSGTTTSVLLLRGHDAESALARSFLLSIPAAFGAAALALVDAGGLPIVDPTVAAAALAVSAVVGYVTIGALMAVVRRVAFWAACVGLGALAVAGGALAIALG